MAHPLALPRLSYSHLPDPKHTTPACGLTIHSSRSRISASPISAVVAVVSASYCYVAARLNSSVRPLKAAHKTVCCSAVVAPPLRRVLGSRHWLVRRASGVSVQLRRACASEFIFSTLQRRDCSLVVGSSGRRYGSRGSAKASRRAQLCSATVAA